MSEVQQTIQQTAARLLKDGLVDVVIGYQRGTAPHKSAPVFLRDAEKASCLIWDESCVNNLAVYLPNALKAERVAVVLTPNDVKSVVELQRENQISGERLRVIFASGQSVTEEMPSDENLLEMKRVLHPLTESYEALNPAERRAFWAEQFSHCIRCYGCRSVCPSCYCPECFVDKNDQLWVNKQVDAKSNWFFHVGRMMHLAGRCIGCGECERACPVGIPLGLLSQKVSQDTTEMFGRSAGDQPADKPLLGQYRENDPDPCPEH